MIFVVSLLLIFNPAAQASFEVSTCDKIDSALFAKVFTESGTSCKTVSEIQEQLRSIKGFAGTNIPLTLFLNAKSYDSYSTYGGLVVLNEVQQAWDNVRPPHQNKNIWSHELGHTFFMFRLGQDFKPIQGFRDYMKEHDLLVIAAKDPKVKTEAKMASKWNSDIGKARDLQAPYSELFADLVAVLAANDPMIMAKSMTSPFMPEQKKMETSYYAFAGKYDLNSWSVEDTHYYFAPTRAYIGEKLLKFPIDNSQKQLVLQKVYQACLQEIQKYWSSSKELPRAAEANKSFIKTLSAL